MPRYLNPKAPFASDVLLPADPAAAMAIAQHVTLAPLMANHSHGLWGYTGETAGGGRLTVQATGIGGPSAAAVLADLAELGVRRAVRVGFAQLAPGAAIGATVVADAAIAMDGASQALGASSPVEADPLLRDALCAAAGVDVSLATVVSTDLHLGGGEARRPADLETAALLAAGARTGVAVASILSVTGDGARPIEPLLALAEVASTALAARAPSAV
jgi:uridine phosphorylase